ncbi:type 2 isopentenyl-diphosphate Delta-isomerase [Desulfotomaculum copahuensis]|uniref:Isopentenyl-diphosphate delta-isomerase n=1 Tax=Desulfotomaculum copahuensis TaxID=1838280 RepID=A0A1B7LFV6_9FIRM|nr:type 2 isopentenyl-diphosphate Delta-isomerase [Desulfotomaculum copahuensis]OAT83592.1 type 2 isopentenyl-diphosphate Delta-isomerase [Desulfotomaculum copahuensis]
MTRKSRKLEHLHYSLQICDRAATAGWEDIALIHQALPEISLAEVKTDCAFLGKPLRAPLMLNAMTGGHPDTAEINRRLARAARRAGIAMAVGSQRAALDEPALAYTYTAAREENPDGVLLANLSAACTPAEAAAAVEMIHADGLQLYLNVPQELAMGGGETDFRGVLANIATLVQCLSVPVIVKEVGFGLSREAVTALYRAGVRYIDVSGAGGTNFFAIESARRGRRRPEMEGWGIPAAVSLLEALQLQRPLFLIASGGLHSALDVAKGLAAGAGLAALARPALQRLVQGSPGELDRWLEQMIGDLRAVMLMAGAADLRALVRKPLVITGRTAEWLRCRGVDVDVYARRPG